MLSLLIILPLIGIFIVLIIPNNQTILIKQIAFIISSITFIGSLNLWVFFDNSTSNFQFIECIHWIPFLNNNFFLGIDGISLFFVILSSFLVWICVLNSWDNVNKYIKEYLICFLFLDSFLIIVFSSLDILIFYIFFESILIPMFLIIGIWGSRTRKLKAGYQFFLYTLVGSLFMLLAIFFILFETGTTDFQILSNMSFYEEKELLLWIAFFLSFSVKVPMIPVHIWLPEAHVEAPTSGSVILAGILLKMGTYGFLRFSLPLFPYASIYFAPFIYVLSAFSVVYSSLTTLRQIDLKKIVAYSSVAHMAFVTSGIFTFNLYGIEGSLLIMLSHGFISSALFLCIGILYDRYHTRLIKYYSGVTQLMPNFAFFFLFFCLANLGFPGTSGFSGEFLSLIGCYYSNTVVGFVISSGMVLSAGYSLWLCNRVLFGPVTVTYIDRYFDISYKECAVLTPLVFCTFWMGIYPEIFLSCMHISGYNIVQKLICL